MKGPETSINTCTQALVYPRARKNTHEEHESVCMSDTHILCQAHTERIQRFHETDAVAADVLEVQKKCHKQEILQDFPQIFALFMWSIAGRSDLAANM